ncbi:MAG TPA: helix-turn-helix transcriptional regulator [Polyangiaceae bacterium]
MADRLRSRFESVARRLTALGLEDPWPEALETLRRAAGGDACLAYGLGRAPRSTWHFEFLHAALGPDPELRTSLAAFQRFITTSSKPWPAYNPRRPPLAQRNVVVSERQLSQSAGQSNRLAGLYRAAGIPAGSPDQVRVLVCDGARLLGWVGVIRRKPLERRIEPLFTKLVPALRARLELDDLLRDRELSRASLDATLGAIEVPSLILDRKGNVEHLNDPARRLATTRPDLLAAARAALVRPSPLFRLHPVLVRGVPASTLVTLCPSPLDLKNGSAKEWRLTPRQKAVLELVVEGLSNKQVASRLGISEGTVELHMTAVFQRTRTSSRAELIARFWAAHWAGA